MTSSVLLCCSILLSCFSALYAIDPKSLDVWLIPSIASADYVTMFQNPDSWSNARSKTNVFGFNTMNIDGSNDWPPNTLANFINASTFKQLAAWNMPITVGPSVIMENSCTPVTDYLMSVYNAVQSNGAQILVMDMDEPLFGGVGTTCNYDIPTSVSLTANWMTSIQKLIPGVVIGDTEPYPSSSPWQWEQFIDGLASANAPLAWFHLDINWQFMYNQIKAGAINATKDLMDIQQFCAQRNLPFGIIIDDLTAQNDDQYYNNTMNNLKFLQGIFGTNLGGMQKLFMSWNYDPPTPNNNIPESQFGTMTNLMNAILDIVGV